MGDKSEAMYHSIDCKTDHSEYFPTDEPSNSPLSRQHDPNNMCAFKDTKETILNNISPLPAQG